MYIAIYVYDLAPKRHAQKIIQPEDNLSLLAALAVRIYMVSLSIYIYLSIYLSIHTYCMHIAIYVYK